jgi:excinuclease UvrABC ATPase subunit
MDLNNCMNDLFRTMNPNKVDANEDTEVALSATTAEFKGICNNCKMPGHMARDCRQEKMNNFKNLGPCKHCGGMHTTTPCK